MNSSVRQNITFGLEFNPNLYEKIVSACALQPDLEMLPAGDSTEIGERGINLSGGQKQRVQLARAVYHDADVFLLDDPLSAVDVHVGRHIFENLIGGFLAGKTRILVTHGVHWLPKCDRVLYISKKGTYEVGTYEELMSQSDGEFAKYINDTKIEEINDDASEIEDSEVENFDVQNRELESYVV